MMPDFIGRDAMQGGEVPGRKQIIDGGAGGAFAPVGKLHQNLRTEDLGIKAPLGMGNQTELGNDLVGCGI